VNPFAIARQIEEDYKAFLRSNFRASDPHLREAFSHALDERNFLIREPYVSLAAPFQLGQPLADLGLAPAVEQRFMEAVFTREPHLPYKHQTDATARIRDGLHTIVATGTGSGKTEAFLMPIIDHCYRHSNLSGPKALLLYPMNALAIDQKKRIADLCAPLGISYGVYVGSTDRGSSKRPPDAPPQERCTREEFEANPPDLFLTNYQMLEYMLLRADGRRIFGKHNVRYVVLDEVHSYRGALGADVALLLRRLKGTLAAANPESASIVFVGTSATLQKDPEGKRDPAEGVAEFFGRLTGERVDRSNVIGEITMNQGGNGSATLPPSPKISHSELDAVDLNDKTQVNALAARLAGGTPSSDTLRDLAHAPIAAFLRRNLASPRGLGEIADALGRLPERENVAREFNETEIEATILLGPMLPTDVPQVLPRIHRFVRGMPALMRCVNPECGKLAKEGMLTCSDCGARLKSLLLCNSCGQDYFVYSPGVARSSAPEICFRVDEARLAQAEDEETSGVSASSDGEIAQDDDIDDDVEVSDSTDRNGEAKNIRADSDLLEGLRLKCGGERRLCPQCGFPNPPDAGECVAPGCGHTVSASDLGYVWHKESVCPVCNSMYTRGKVLKSLKLSNSPAVSWITRAAMHALPDEARKILIFCDSRQDAAHQARYIRGLEDQLFARRAIVRALRDEGIPLDMTALAGALVSALHKAHRLDFDPRTVAGKRRALKIAMGTLLSLFVYESKRRDSLERLGIVRVAYPALQEVVDDPDFARLCTEYGLDHNELHALLAQLLDAMRSSAGAHLGGPLKPNEDPLLEYLSRFADKGNPLGGLAREYGLNLARGVGQPIVYADPGEAGRRERAAYTVSPLFGKSNGGPLRALLSRLDLPSNERLDVALAIVKLLRRHKLLVDVSAGRGKQRTSGLSVPLTAVEVGLAEAQAACALCNALVGDGKPGDRCPKPRCGGRLVAVSSVAESENTDVRAILADESIALHAEEHSAAVGVEKRDEIEQSFQSEPSAENPDPVNVLACTPTLEVGVNIGALEAVAMRNVPPSPANYAQRAGRTGRRTRMGIIHTFAQPRPHDGFFFDHPGEMIAGEIPPPRFNLENREGVARHIHSIVLEVASLGYEKNLASLIDAEGDVIREKFDEMLRAIEGAETAALARAELAVRDLKGIDSSWVRREVGETKRLVANTVERRAEAIKIAAEKFKALGIPETVTLKREQDRWRNLCLGLRLGTDSDQSAYLPRLLAEAGVIPGYAFPRDPGSLTLGFDASSIFASRIQAQREYAPGQIVYARGQRWRVQGIALFRPDQIGGSGLRLEGFKMCPCGQANQQGANYCIRTNCGLPLEGVTQYYADVASFYSREQNVDPLSEEERAQESVDSRPHPLYDGRRNYYALGDPSGDGLTLVGSEQERIRQINHGRSSPRVRGGEVVPYRICEGCGRAFDPLVEVKIKGRRGENSPTELVPSEGERDHAKRDGCHGRIIDIALGHEFRADTLRIPVPLGLRFAGEAGVRWAWSVGAALQQGAIRRFALDPDDLTVSVLMSEEDKENPSAGEVLLIDEVIGGSGVISEIVQNFAEVARAALEHLADHDCESSCYRCLRTYRNARYARHLSWRSAVGFLENAAAESLTLVKEEDLTRDEQDSEAWREAREEGCGSPAELRLLKALRDLGVPEPQKQYELKRANGSLLSSADFAWPGERVLVYVDGLKYHSTKSGRERDARITRELQQNGWRVERFLGSEVWRDPSACASQIGILLSGGASPAEPAAT
jgi:Lhr-like helicase